MRMEVNREEEVYFNDIGHNYGCDPSSGGRFVGGY